MAQHARGQTGDYASTPQPMHSPASILDQGLTSQGPTFIYGGAPDAVNTNDFAAQGYSSNAMMAAGSRLPVHANVHQNTPLPASAGSISNGYGGRQLPNDHRVEPRSNGGYAPAHSQMITNGGPSFQQSAGPSSRPLQFAAQPQHPSGQQHFDHPMQQHPAHAQQQQQLGRTLQADYGHSAQHVAFRPAGSDAPSQAGHVNMLQPSPSVLDGAGFSSNSLERSYSSEQGGALKRTGSRRDTEDERNGHAPKGKRAKRAADTPTEQDPGGMNVNKEGESPENGGSGKSDSGGGSGNVTMFQCRGFGDCKMVFTRSEHLARHVRKHTGERPFKCHCGKAFSRLDNLRQHAQTVHADTPDRNETMMQELTALHTSLAQSAAQMQHAKAQVLGKSSSPGALIATHNQTGRKGRAGKAAAASRGGKASGKDGGCVEDSPAGSVAEGTFGAAHPPHQALGGLPFATGFGGRPLHGRGSGAPGTAGHGPGTGAFQSPGYDTPHHSSVPADSPSFAEHTQAQFSAIDPRRSSSGEGPPFVGGAAYFEYPHTSTSSAPFPGQMSAAPTLHNGQMLASLTGHDASVSFQSADQPGFYHYDSAAPANDRHRAGSAPGLAASSGGHDPNLSFERQQRESYSATPFERSDGSLPSAGFEGDGLLRGNMGTNLPGDSQFRAILGGQQGSDSGYVGGYPAESLHVKQEDEPAFFAESGLGGAEFDGARAWRRRSRTEEPGLDSSAFDSRMLDGHYAADMAYGMEGRDPAALGPAFTNPFWKRSGAVDAFGADEASPFSHAFYGAAADSSIRRPELPKSSFESTLSAHLHMRTPTLSKRTSTSVRPGSPTQTPPSRQGPRGSFDPGSFPLLPPPGSSHGVRPISSHSARPITPHDRPVLPPLSSLTPSASRPGTAAGGLNGLRPGSRSGSLAGLAGSHLPGIDQHLINASTDPADRDGKTPSARRPSTSPATGLGGPGKPYLPSSSLRTGSRAIATDGGTGDHDAALATLPRLGSSAGLSEFAISSERRPTTTGTSIGPKLRPLSRGGPTPAALPPLSSTLAGVEGKRASLVSRERDQGTRPSSSRPSPDLPSQSRPGSSRPKSAGGPAMTGLTSRLNTIGSDLRTSPPSNASPFMFQPPPLPKESGILQSGQLSRRTSERPGSMAGLGWRRPGSSSFDAARLGSSGGVRSLSRSGPLHDGEGASSGPSDAMLPPLKAAIGGLQASPAGRGIMQRGDSDPRRPSLMDALERRSSSWSRPVTSGGEVSSRRTEGLSARFDQEKEEEQRMGIERWRRAQQSGSYEYGIRAEDKGHPDGPEASMPARANIGRRPSTSAGGGVTRFDGGALQVQRRPSVAGRSSSFGEQRASDEPAASGGSKRQRSTTPPASFSRDHR